MTTGQTEPEGKSLPRPRKPWVAVLLSVLIFPGYGQIYNGKPKQGLTIAIAFLSFLPLFLVTWSYLSTSITLFVIVVIVNTTVLITVIVHAFRQCKRGDPNSPRQWYSRRLGIISVWLMMTFISSRYMEFIRYVVQPYKIPTSSMAPTIEKGDFILARGWYKGLNVLNRGDIVVFKYPKDEKKDFAKRVIGLPMETVEVKERKVYVNGQELIEPYATHETSIPNERLAPEMVNFGPVTVPEGEFFVLGDNREHSLDSRFFGFVSQSKIKGKAALTYWSWDGERDAVRWNRIGLPLDQK